MQKSRKTMVLSREVTLLRREQIEEALTNLGSSRPESALFCNVHMLMLSQQDPGLASAMDTADQVFADGVPVAWLQARLYREDAAVLRGHEAMLRLCQLAAASGRKVGLYGSTADILDALQLQLAAQCPGLNIAYAHSPAFTEDVTAATDAELASINAASLTYLFVGLGCPKQEKWIAQCAKRLNCSLLGVGAAFDWLAGTRSKPPAWMEDHGLGWLHRLASEPGRLGARYLVHNSRFVLAAGSALWKHRRNVEAVSP